MSESTNIRSGSARPRKRPGESGISLLELMIAMAVLTIGMLGSMVLIVIGMESNQRSKTDNAATILDQEILEMFATLNNYPKPGSVIVYDCALSAGSANQHLASLGQGTYASGGNGAPLNSTGDIDWTQPTPTLATSTTAGYAMKYQTCSGDTYEVRWNIMDGNNPAPTLPAVSRISLLTVSSRETAAKGSNQAMLYAPPTTLRTLIESSQF
jgi:type II secretory pathway pseudopilin PulG